jgi:hypothetical protein
MKEYDANSVEKTLSLAKVNPYRYVDIDMMKKLATTIKIQDIIILR